MMKQWFSAKYLLCLVLFLFYAPGILLAECKNGTVPGISIPSLNISSPIVEFPLGYSTWTIDPWETQVGHLEGTADLGQGGNIVLAAHSRMPNLEDGIFAKLPSLHEGDEIIVFDGQVERVYQVVEVLYVDYTDLSVLYPTVEEQLTLITCDVAGGYNTHRQDYNQRVVVVATRVDY
ncbi:MAG: sortase [Anaerolineaceae bacterium]|nr:sortase [Anaerolineaceae bacterium]